MIFMSPRLPEMFLDLMCFEIIFFFSSYEIELEKQFLSTLLYK